jgi:autotransporter-associated beta strand protein
MRRRWRPIALLLGGAVLWPLQPPSAHATSATWTGTGDANWATLGNWSANPVPGTGDTATFGAINGGHTTISLGGGITISTLAFDTNSTGYTIGSGAVGSQTLTLNNGGSIQISNVFPQSNQLINANLLLGTNANAGTFTLSSLRAGFILIVAGNISGGAGGTAGAKTLAIDGNGDTTLSGVIGNGGATSLAITKTGGGKLTLSGTNTFTGALTISQGFVSVPVINNASANGPLGNSAAAVTLGGTLIYTGATASSTKKFALAAGSGEFAIESAASELTLSGVISGSGRLDKDGLGTLTLTTANTYSGGTQIAGGTLKVSGAATLGNGSGSLQVSNQLSYAGILDLNGTAQTVGGLNGNGTILNDGGGASVLTVNPASGTSNIFTGTLADHDNATAGTLALTKGGAGVVSLQSSNSYTGATTINGGLLDVQNANGLGNTGSVTVNSGSLRIYHDLGAVPVTISGAGAAGEGGAFESLGSATYSGLLKLGASATVAAEFFGAGSSLALTNPGVITGAGFTLTLVAPDGTGSVASVIGTGAGGVTINGPFGKWTLTGANTFAGALTVNDFATLIVPTVNNANTDGPLGHSAAAVTLNEGILEYTGATASSTKPFAIASAAHGTILVDTDTTELTLSGLISGATGTLVKDGPGTLTLTNGSNSYGGGTTIYDGTLKLSGPGKLGSPGGFLDLEAGTLDLNGASPTVGQLSGAGGTVLNNGGGLSTLTVNTTDTALIYYGSIADNDGSSPGTVALVKSGAGILSLFAVNSYGGATTVSAGMLSIGDGSALGGTTAGTTVSGGATLLLAGQDMNIDPEPLTISGAGNVGNGALGALESGDDGNVFTGLITLGAAATIASDAGLFKITNPGSITGPTFALTLTGAGDGEIDSIIGTTSGAVSKTGAGAWTLTGANTYSGLTTVSAGILNIQNGSALGATTNGTTVASGATLQIQGNITVGAEALTISGAGALGATGALENVSDNNTFGGLLTIAAAATITSDTGTLTLSNPGTLVNAGGVAITFDGAGDGSLAAKIPAASIIKKGAGTWTFSGANAYTGATTINEGTLDIQNPSALGTTTNGTTVASGATLLIDGNLAIGAEALTIGGAGASGKTGALELIANATASFGGLLKLGASAAVSSEAGATLSLTNTGTIFGTSTGFALTLTGTGHGSLAGIWNGGVSGTPGAGTLTKAGLGTWTLTGANSFTGTLSVQAGTLSVPTFNNAGSAGPLGNSAGAVVLGSNGVAGNLEYTGGTASSNKLLSLVNTGGGVQVDNAATELTLTGGISGSATTEFHKRGPGTLTLATADSFNGVTYIDEGTLKVSATGALSGEIEVGFAHTGILQLAGTGDRIGDTSTIVLRDGSTVSMAGLSNQSETMGFLAVLGFTSSIIDFGSGSGDSLLFTGVSNNLNKLSLRNWSGTPGVLGTVATDRLIFAGTSSDFTSLFTQSEVSFNGSNGYLALQYDATHYELVAVPEPSAAALLGAATLLDLLRGRPRRGSHSGS